MSCPLCGHNGSQLSWLGSTFYGGEEFSYSECSACKSSYCDPMPDEDVLAHMYGPEYATTLIRDEGISDPKEPEHVLEWLEKLESATFVDYGCGSGSLLVEAAHMGWTSMGVELDANVAQEVAQKTGSRVVADPSDLLEAEDGAVDVLHLGDVIEHLTHLDQQMPQILHLLKSGGILLAQGPLEAGPTLFTFFIRLGRMFRHRRRAEMAPYHVILATVQGQRRFFQRLGLEELEYSIHEVSWPAPDKLSSSDWKCPRRIVLFLIRRLSRAASAIRPSLWGNRYFYAGRKY